MRALLISSFALLIFINGWAIFYQYSCQTLHQLTDSFETEVISAIENEDWDKAYELFAEQYQQWQCYQKKALYMLETESVNNTEEGFAKTLMYIKAKDLSNSIGELLALQMSLKALYQSETVQLNNIF